MNNWSDIFKFLIRYPVYFSRSQHDIYYLKKTETPEQDQSYMDTFYEIFLKITTTRPPSNTNKQTQNNESEKDNPFVLCTFRKDSRKIKPTSIQYSELFQRP